MKRLIIFGGTSDSRALIERLSKLHVSITVSVATEYGASLLTEQPNIAVRTGALNADEIKRLLEEGNFAAVIDATHPYAALASINIRAAADAVSLQYLRLLRPKSETNRLPVYRDISHAIATLVGTEGAILAATGVKELAEYTRLPGFSQRVYPRVLPTVESVGRAIELGFSPSRIIAMQGPFSYELNRAMMAQCGIRYIVTKDGGTAGGFEEKADAARSLGVELLLIARPPETAGLSEDEVLQTLAGIID